VLARVGQLDSARTAAARAIVGAAAAEVAAIALLEPGELPANQLEQLEAIWRGVWPKIVSALPSDAVPRLADVRALWW